MTADRLVTGISKHRRAFISRVQQSRKERLSVPARESAVFESSNLAIIIPLSILENETVVTTDKHSNRYSKLCQFISA
jgi:hypothetical protein